MRAWWLVLCACGRVGFTPSADDGAVGDVPPQDIASDAVPVCTGPFGTPVPIAELNTTADEWGAVLSDDGLEMFFGSNRSGAMGYDIYVATRSSRSVPFDPPTRIDVLATVGDDDNAFLSVDGLTLWFDSAGSIYTSTRASRTSAWQPPQSVAELNTAFNASVALSADERTVYFASTRAGGVGNYDLWMATRMLFGGSFSAPTLVPGVNSAAFDCCPHVAGGGRSLLLHTNQFGGGTKIASIDLDASGVPTGPLSLFAPTGMTGEQVDVAVTRDDSLLVFASRPTVGTGQFDLYLAERTCP